MRNRDIKVAALLIMGLGGIGCTDKAQPEYAKCLQLEASDDLAAAWGACTAAIGLDPNSTSGKAAASKLNELKPKYEAWKAQEAAQAAAAAEEAARKAAAAEEEEARRKAAAVVALREKIEVSPAGSKWRSHCLSEGKPPVGRLYEGGSYAENYEVAVTDGCQPAMSKLGEVPTFNYYCCPE